MLPININLSDNFFEEEVINGYTVSTERKKMWAVYLDLMKKLIDFCADQQLNIYAFGGTLLGAVRDGNFIPWDDNVDFAMPREDYDILLKYFPSTFEDGSPYALVNINLPMMQHTCKFYTKFGNTQTTWLTNSCCYDSLNCISVAIHPLDNVSDDSRESKSMCAQLGAMRKYITTMCHSHMMQNNMWANMVPLEENIEINIDDYNKRIESTKEIKGENYCIYNLSSFHKPLILPKKYFNRFNRQINNTATLPFSILEIPVPYKYEEVCKKLFGKDYMTPKQESKRETVKYFNAEKPWAEYKEENPLITNDELPISITLPEGFCNHDIREGYKVPSLMKQTWAVELDILKIVIDICNKYNIKYFADGGTLLGAVRHNGFIPWDDDVDIVMFRNDYDRFLEVLPNELDNERYYFINNQVSDNFKSQFTKVGNLDTTMICSGHRASVPNTIAVDIFPLDDVPEDRKSRWTFYREYRANKKKPIPEILSNYNVENTPYASIVALSKITKEWLKDKRYYGDGVMLPFEFMEIRVPEKYEEACAMQYGETWREPIIGASVHQTIDVRPFTPWENYNGKAPNYNHVAYNIE